MTLLELFHCRFERQDTDQGSRATNVYNRDRELLRAVAHLMRMMWLLSDSTLACVCVKTGQTAKT